MKQRGQNALVGIGSVAGVRGFAGAGAYSPLRKRLYVRIVKVCVSNWLPAGACGDDCSRFIRTPMTAVNPYRMPFLMPVQAFSQQAVHAIEHGRSW